MLNNASPLALAIALFLAVLVIRLLWRLGGK